MKKALILAAALMAAVLAGPSAHALTTISSNVTTDTTWGATDNEYALNAPIFVTNNSTLTILPGTTVYGITGLAVPPALIIARGSKLIADGSPDKPIVFTSDADVKSQGQWGGIIINGYAPLNNPAVEMQGEGDTGLFGGENPHDNSGILRYVRVEAAGTEFTPENELNGIAFQGVGDATIVDHVQVHLNQDDGIEMFGGTVNSKYVLITGAGDDSFDWTLGWNGKAQFWVCQQYGYNADNGIEADNWAEDNDARPRAFPSIYNVTLVGDPDADLGDESDLGMLLREGTAGTFRNAIVIGFKETGIVLDHNATFEQAQAGNLTVDSCIFFNNTPNYDTSKTGGSPAFNTQTFMTTMMANNFEVNPFLVDPYDTADPDFRPTGTSPAANGTVPVATPPQDGFFEMVDYIGGVDPDYDWTKEPWTTIGGAPATPVAAQILGVTTNLHASARVGQKFPFTVNAVGPDGAEIEYRFYLLPNFPNWDEGSRPWQLVQDWSSSNVYNYVLPVTGKHFIAAHVRVAGETWGKGDPLAGMIVTAE